MEVDLFTSKGDRVARVRVIFERDGKLPLAVRHVDRVFVYQSGRYVETSVPSVGLAEVVGTS